MEENNNPETLPTIEKNRALRSVVTHESSYLLDTVKFEHLQRVASMFSHSTIVPEIYRNSPANCFIAAHLANQIGVDPFVFMQNSYIVSGKPSIEGKLVIALLNSRGCYPDGVRFEFKGEGETRCCKAIGTRQDGTKDEMEVSVKQAKEMGWYARNASWKNLTDLMLKYRSATYLCRTSCPEILYGLDTKEELIDVHGVQVVTQSNSGKRVSSLNDKLSGEQNVEAN